MAYELERYLSRNREDEDKLRPGMRPEVRDYLVGKKTPPDPMEFRSSPIPPSSFDVAGSASTATVPSLQDPDEMIRASGYRKEDEDFAASLQRQKDNPYGLEIQSPFEGGTQEDLEFRLSKQPKLDFTPAKPEIPAIETTPAPKAGPVPVEPEIVEPEAPEKSDYEMLLEDMQNQLIKDVQRADKTRIPQLIAAAFAGFGDALVARAGGQPTNALQNVLGGREKALGRLDTRGEAILKGRRGLEEAKTTQATAKAKEARSLAKEAESRRRWETEQGYKRRAEGRGIEETRLATEEMGRATAEGRKNTLYQANNMIETTDKAIEQLGAGVLTAGESGRFAAKIPGVRQYRIDLENTISTLKANQAFQTLQKMREASKTGGALGQVSERELTLLQNALTALDINPSDEQLKRNLEKVKSHWERARWAVGQIEERGGEDVPIGSLGMGEMGGGMGQAGDPLGLFY